MNECCVCYNDYDNKTFAIRCLHNVCYTCFSSIKNKLCPLCRCSMKLKYRKQEKRIKGKLNLNKYNKIKTHLQYKYRLEGRVKNKMRDNKNLYIRRCLCIT